jgi:ketopantoate reductase
MRVGILGSGLMGGKLGTLFARAGHEVVFSYARSEQKLQRLAHGRPRARRGPAHRERPRRKRTRYCSPCTGRESTMC